MCLKKKNIFTFFFFVRVDEIVRGPASETLKIYIYKHTDMNILYAIKKI